jgi:hypothetical protein
MLKLLSVLLLLLLLDLLLALCAQFSLHHKTLLLLSSSLFYGNRQQKNKFMNFHIQKTNLSSNGITTTTTKSLFMYQQCTKMGELARFLFLCVSFRILAYTIAARIYISNIHYYMFSHSVLFVISMKNDLLLNVCLSVCVHLHTKCELTFDGFE